MKATEILFYATLATASGCVEDNRECATQECNPGQDAATPDTGTADAANAVIDGSPKPDFQLETDATEPLLDSSAVKDSGGSTDVYTEQPDGMAQVDAGIVSDAVAPTPDIGIAPDAAVIPPQDRCRVRVRDIIDGVGNVQTFCGPGRGQVDTYINDYILGPEGVCNRNVDAIATQVWVVVTPNEAVFETSGNCDAIEVFSGERHTDVIPNQDPGVGAERVNFIEGSLTIDGRPPQPNIATYFDVRGTNLNPQR